MSNDIVVLEKQLTSLAPQFSQALGTLMTPERLIRTVLTAAERTPKLLECSRQSLFNSVMSAAVLGLELDGVTGQAFLIPFEDRRSGQSRAQLVIGFKGYNTLAARSGLTLSGAVVREGDAFDFELGDRGFVKHKPKLEGRDRRIIAAWAVAAALDRPAVVTVLGIDELMATKAKSPGAKRADSPWNDPAIGFPAMCEKTAKRRLARSLPLNIVQLAARMEEAFDEQGRHSYILPARGVVIEGDASPLPEREQQAPTTEQLISPPTQPPPDSLRPPAAEAAAPLGPSPMMTSGAADTRARTGNSESALPGGGSGCGSEQSLPDWDWAEYSRQIEVICDAARNADELGKMWNCDFHQRLRRKIDPPREQLDWLKDRVSFRIKDLKKGAARDRR